MNENYCFSPIPVPLQNVVLYRIFLHCRGGGSYLERAAMQRNLKKVEIVGELGLTRALIIPSISINLFFFVNRNLLLFNTNFSQGIICLH